MRNDPEISDAKNSSSRNLAAKAESQKIPVLLTARHKNVFRRDAAARRIAHALLFARNAARLSQREVARRMGVSAATVCRMEEQPDAVQTFGNVANFLGALGVELSTTLSSAPRQPIRIMGSVWHDGGLPGHTTPRPHRARAAVAVPG